MKGTTRVSTILLVVLIASLWILLGNGPTKSGRFQPVGGDFVIGLDTTTGRACGMVESAPKALPKCWELR